MMKRTPSRSRPLRPTHALRACDRKRFSVPLAEPLHNGQRSPIERPMPVVADWPSVDSAPTSALAMFGHGPAISCNRTDRSDWPQN